MQQNEHLHGDVFTRWIVGVAGAIVVSVGVLLMTELSQLRQDMVIVKENTKSTFILTGDHEQRIRNLEQTSRNNKCTCENCGGRKRGPPSGSPAVAG